MEEMLKEDRILVIMDMKGETLGIENSRLKTLQQNKM